MMKRFLVCLAVLALASTAFGKGLIVIPPIAVEGTNSVAYSLSSDGMYVAGASYASVAGYDVGIYWSMAGGTQGQIIGGRELRVGSYVEPSILFKSWSQDEDSSRANTIAIDLALRNALEGYHGAMGDYHVRVRTQPAGDTDEQDTGWKSRMRRAEPFYREALT